MLDADTFLITLYVAVDDCCKTQDTARDTADRGPRHPGPPASLTPSEVVTLAVAAEWGSFPSARAFYRYAQHHLRAAFPTLPDCSQLNRLVRAHEPLLVRFFCHLVEQLEATHAPYEALDTTAVPTRNAKRRHAGWLPGLEDIGWSNRPEWYEGFHLLCTVTPEGILTGFGFGPASANDRPLAEAFFAARGRAHLERPRPERWMLPSMLPSVGPACPACYVTDKGFFGRAARERWASAYGAVVICPPPRDARAPWPKALRRWLAGVRQIVETVYEKLHRSFRLSAERPHALGGFQARLAAMAALHNFCIWVNRHLDRPALAFVDLVVW